MLTSFKESGNEGSTTQPVASEPRHGGRTDAGGQPGPGAGPAGGNAAFRRRAGAGATAEPTAPERIVVTGTRASLLRARELKRNATVVQDSIAAEDLGRFPTTTSPTRCRTSPA
jgi:hypothetical protein